MKLALKTFIPTAAIVALLLFSFVTSSRADTLSTTRDSSALYSKQADSFPSKIVKIFINGNKVTRPEIIRMYIGLDTGMTYDSTLTAVGKRRLLNTNLFSKVDVVPIRKIEGVNVYVIVAELFYLIPEGGGDYIQGRYGDSTLPIWYRLRLGLTVQNFRGRFETFSIRTSIWEDRSLSIAWSKPFVPTPYFAGIGAGIRDYPDINNPWRRMVVNGRISGGRTLFGNSRLSLSLIPTYSRINTRDETGVLAKFKEVYSVLAWSTDGRDRSYDPRKGWSFYTDALTNTLCSDYNRYLQIDGDIRLYHGAFFSQDRFAYRVQTAIRSNDGGIYKGLYIGGEATVRGFGQDQLGPNTTNGDAVMNDYTIATAEYRFPIWTMPCIDVWLLSDYADMFKEFYTRFDGAVFVDAGRIWHDLSHPCLQKQDGTGFGAGIRAMAPTLRRSVCFDIAWGAIPHGNPLHLVFLNEPAYYLYLDTYF